MKTELYQPLDAYETFYIRANLFYDNKKVYPSSAIIGDHSIKSNLNDTIIVQTKEYGGLVGVGMNVSNNLRIEVSNEQKHVKPSIDLIVSKNGTSTYSSNTAEANVNLWKASFEYDSLDSAFPKEGTHILGYIK